MKFIRKRIIRPIVILLIILVPIVSFAKGSFSFTFGASDGDYSEVLRDGVTVGDTRIVDIAMLGAHDAFSHNITATSPVDPAELDDSIVRNETLDKFADGVFVRLSKAQKSGAAQLLQAGVRYFDVRLSFYEAEWYTKHAFISDKLSTYLDEIIPFLSENPGEFIIFDMQHVYLGESNWGDLFDFLSTYEVAGVALTDFIHYDPLTSQLRDLTYDIVTDNGSSAGIVMLAKQASSVSLPYHYNRGNGDTAIVNIRSLWHNTSDSDTLLAGIREEFDYLNDAIIYEDILRVNQAQKTGALTDSDLWDTILGWSLLDMANNSNKLLISQEDFADWLTVMPIFMVDFADSPNGNFNTLANEAFIAYNQAL